MSEEKKPYLIINKEHDEIQINIKHTKPYIDLQQENKQLKDKINTYENPEDMTLMYMWCDEKAKDKIKQLKEMHETMTKYAIENEVKVDKYKEVIEEVRERSKLERKTALSLNQHYAVSIIDSVLQILDKVKENKNENR